MGKIKVLKEEELVGSTSTTPVYPVTAAQAVYLKNGETVEEAIKKNSTFALPVEGFPYFHSGHTIKEVPVFHSDSDSVVLEEVPGYKSLVIDYYSFTQYDYPAGVYFPGHKTIYWMNEDKDTALLSGLYNEIPNSNNLQYSYFNTVYIEDFLNIHFIGQNFDHGADISKELWDSIQRPEKLIIVIPEDEDYTDDEEGGPILCYSPSFYSVNNTIKVHNIGDSYVNIETLNTTIINHPHEGQEQKENVLHLKSENALGHNVRYNIQIINLDSQEFKVISGSHMQSIPPKKMAYGQLQSDTLEIIYKTSVDL